MSSQDMNIQQKVQKNHSFLTNFFSLLCGNLGYCVTRTVLHACEDFLAMCCPDTIKPVTCCAEGSDIHIALVQKKVWWSARKKNTNGRQIRSQQSCCVSKFDTNISRNFQTSYGVPVHLWNLSAMKASSVQAGGLEERRVIILSKFSLSPSTTAF